MRRVTVFLARDRNALKLGEEVASGLGSRVPVQRGLVLLTAVARWQGVWV